MNSLICAVLAEDCKTPWHRMSLDHEFSTLKTMSSVQNSLSIVFIDALSGEKVITVCAARPLLKHSGEHLGYFS